jgi:hypothetical protein
MKPKRLRMTCKRDGDLFRVTTRIGNRTLLLGEDITRELAWKAAAETLVRYAGDMVPRVGKIAAAAMELYYAAESAPSLVSFCDEIDADGNIIPF